MINKNSINNTIANIIILISWIILICSIVTSVIVWKKTSNLVYVISGIIATVGGLFNIYLLYKEKSYK
ncbi:hypothetical protein K7185_08040 [Clostridium butyricum]|uniref:hypothetical protein n=1 Tax=Clostridium butyricum TaxID=1492 RepID=UPI001CA7BF81|nr:hypothetical protein [Clostridium butyricum]MBZ0312421.1 hypothetical protein [Clostridium butyricum]